MPWSRLESAWPGESYRISQARPHEHGSEPRRHVRTGSGDAPAGSCLPSLPAPGPHAPVSAAVRDAPGVRQGAWPADPSPRRSAGPAPREQAQRAAACLRRARGNRPQPGRLLRDQRIELLACAEVRRIASVAGAAGKGSAGTNARSHRPSPRLTPTAPVRLMPGCRDRSALVDSPASLDHAVSQGSPVQRQQRALHPDRRSDHCQAVPIEHPSPLAAVRFEAG